MLSSPTLFREMKSRADPPYFTRCNYVRWPIARKSGKSTFQLRPLLNLRVYLCEAVYSLRPVAHCLKVQPLFWGNILLFFNPSFCRMQEMKHHAGGLLVRGRERLSAKILPTSKTTEVARLRIQMHSFTAGENGAG